MERAKLTQEHERQQQSMAKELQHHLKENAALSAKVATDLSVLRQEADKSTSKYKAEEARLLADLEEMKKAESALRDSYKKELEIEQKMHLKTQRVASEMREKLAEELEKEEKLKIELDKHMEHERSLEEELASMRANLSSTSKDKNQKLRELEDARKENSEIKSTLAAALVAATSEREEAENTLRAELAAQKAANKLIQEEAQQKQLQLDRLIADEKDRATEHEKTMEKLHTLEISDEEKATLLQEAQRSLDQSNIDLHELEKKLLEELANERAAVNKFKAESDEAKQQWDETEKSRRQIAGKLDNAARRNDDLSKRTFLSFFFVFFVFCFLFFVFCFLFFVFCFLFL